MSPATSWLLVAIVVGLPVAIGFYIEHKRKNRRALTVLREAAERDAAKLRHPSVAGRRMLDDEGEALPPRDVA